MSGKTGARQTALLRQWQTAALLLLVLGFALSATRPAGHVPATLQIDWLLLAAPFGVGAVSMQAGRHRLAALCDVMGACAAALIFWSMLFAVVSGLIVAGLTGATVEAGTLAALLIGAAGTLSSAAGSLWRLPDAPRRSALGRGPNDRQAIEAGAKG